MAATHLLAVTAQADALHDHDNGPLTGNFGIPDSTEGSILLEPATGRLTALLSIANHSIGDTRDSETLILDGETTRFEFSYSRGIVPRVEVGIELPYLWHESGGLDPLVDFWHDTFGFPGGFRSVRPRGQLEFLYVDALGTQVDVRRNVNGFSDARVFGAYQLLANDKHTLALRAGIKLPTGDAEQLLGTGGTDISVGIAGDFRELFGISGLSSFYRANAVRIGEPELLADRYNELIAHAALGLGKFVASSVELRFQAAYRSAVYDSPIENLGDASAIVTFGANIRLSDRFHLSIAVTEDIKVNSAPDVAFHIALRRHSK